MTNFTTQPIIARPTLLQQYALTYRLAPTVFRQAMQIARQIDRERPTWDDPQLARHCLWAGAALAAAQLAGERETVRFDQHQASHRFFAWVNDDSDTHLVERWVVYPSNFHHFAMWHCSCLKKEHNAPTRTAAPTLDAPVVRYCPHIYAAVLVAHLSGR